MQTLCPEHSGSKGRHHLPGLVKPQFFWTINGWNNRAIVFFQECVRQQLNCKVNSGLKLHCILVSFLLQWLQKLVSLPPLSCLSSMFDQDRKEKAYTKRSNRARNEKLNILGDINQRTKPQISDVVTIWLSSFLCLLRFQYCWYLAPTHCSDFCLWSSCALRTFS